MPVFGSFTLVVALALALYSMVAGTAGVVLLRRGDPNRAWAALKLRETSRRAGIAIFAAVTAAAIALLYAAFTDDFSVAYILHHSNKALPGPYKFAALWSGQEGSLLFWAWLLAAYGLVLRVRHKVDTRLVAHASVILAAIQVFFLLLLNFAAHPFALMSGPVAADGNGLNPLLQYAEMVIHPPMLYLGYVGFSVPFAFALGALIMKYPGEKWIHITRRWTMVTWLFLGCGIALGSHWAYSVLGWGGYWGWDPVEDASFMPWLTGTAFLHSVMMQEKRGMLKVWNVWLIFITFMLCILGTLLTRSGAVASVHAFAQSSIGTWFSAFLALVFVVCVFFFVKNREHLKSENRLEAVVSRESSFLFNNLLLLAGCFTILWGTLFPLLSEWIAGTKVTVGPPFFNRVTIPIFLALLLLTALGPLLSWRKSSLESLKRNFAVPSIIAIGAGGVLIGFGMRPWKEVSEAYSFVAMVLGVLVTATIGSEFWRGARVISSHTGEGIFAGMVHLTRRNTRRYGGYIVHFAMVVIAIGLAGAAFNQDKEQELGNGDSMSIGGYTLVCRSYSQDDNANYETESAIVDVFRNGKFVTTMYPERRFYKASQQASTMVANHSMPSADLYLVYAGRNDGSDKPILRVHLNPLVMWLWVGVWIFVLGTLVTLVPNKAAVTLRKPVQERVPAMAEGD
ncbi:MAG: heme lyase CcmF/NrfE family subunit [Terriglobales bacterium]